MRLFIAEKPSLAQVIASGLGGGKRDDGFIKVNGACVTWCFGHMYELANPEDYDPGLKQWQLETLPIIPDQFKRLPRSDAKKQIGIVKNLLKDASEVVNAGDPDREGQLLVDELLEELGWTGPTNRIWLEALDDSSVQKALGKIKPNSEYKGLRDAAEARSLADWTFGINLTRAYTIKGRQSGYDGVLSVGRVQTPTLALVVKRDLEIENFKAKPFYSITATFQAAKGAYAGIWQVPEDHADPEGRCLDKALIDGIVQGITGKPGRIIEAESKKKSQKAELPFSLSALQSYCSSKWGMGAQKVLDIAQKLYEQYKATTYPRTDCRYLSEGALDEVAATLAAIGKADPEMSAFLSQCDAAAHPRCFNSQKITAHTGIIPTTHAPDLSAMTKDELKVYDAIRRRYMAQFMPDYVFMDSVIVTKCEGHRFKTTGKVPVSSGWRVLAGDGVEPDDDQESGEEEETPGALPTVSQGEGVTCADAGRKDKETKPPARFTEGTLIAAMANIARYVDDPAVKQRLKESAGIGTEATRAGIIETLKSRDYLVPKGKAIISSDTARKFIAVLPRVVTDPATTAGWEQALEGIVTGRAPLEKFLAVQKVWIANAIETAKKTTLSGLDQSPGCPTCKEGKLRRRPGKDGHFWGCTNYPECKTTFPDKKGAPDLAGKKKPKGGGKWKKEPR